MRWSGSRFIPRPCISPGGGAFPLGNPSIIHFLYGQGSREWRFLCLIVCQKRLAARPPHWVIYSMLGCHWATPDHPWELTQNAPQCWVDATVCSPHTKCENPTIESRGTSWYGVVIITAMMRTVGGVQSCTDGTGSANFWPRDPRRPDPVERRERINASPWKQTRMLTYKKTKSPVVKAVTVKMNVLFAETVKGSLICSALLWAAHL